MHPIKLKMSSKITLSKMCSNMSGWIPKTCCDRLSSYLSPVPSSTSMATCLACKISFSISVLGVGQVYRHARLAGHKEAQR